MNFTSSRASQGKYGSSLGAVEVYKEAEKPK